MDQQNNDRQLDEILSQAAASLKSQAEAMNREQQTEANAQTLQATKRVMKKKSTLLTVTALILVVVLSVLAIAWYTRLANMHAVTMDVADYDLAINENVDDEFYVNVYEYSKDTDKLLNSQHVAPGSVGWIPLRISAKHSDVDVNFTLSIANKMPEELQKRIRFFYLKDTNNKIYYGDRLADTGLLSNYTRVYLDSDNDQLTDAIDFENEHTKTLCIYWEWYQDADEAYERQKTYGLQNIPSNKINENKVIEAYVEEWDELDTDIGKYPEKYVDSMTVYIHSSGAQVTLDLVQKGTAGETQPEDSNT